MRLGELIQVLLGLVRLRGLLVNEVALVLHQQTGDVGVSACLCILIDGGLPLHRLLYRARIH